MNNQTSLANELSGFSGVLNAPGTQLVNILHPLTTGTDTGLADRLERMAKHFKLNSPQFVCAIGFNAELPDYPDVTALLGFSSFEKLIEQRNRVFTKDIYKEIPIDW